MTPSAVSPGRVLRAEAVPASWSASYLVSQGFDDSGPPKVRRSLDADGRPAHAAELERLQRGIDARRDDQHPARERAPAVYRRLPGTRAEQFTHPRGVRHRLQHRPAVRRNERILGGGKPAVTAAARARALRARA